ncbi:MAG: NAD(P)/FAD-dependent oxidoreductase [Desmonostoc vinosum HA7617-LM4]|jgi:pyruvate/2-oxoglutarate dehydrogenase complex dihydrolipoamide dehydrogenase (E3) component|nr:NAD(P)/FAD-dependent oxidoreductase [Desmonostoc vinosum HA7617-LM4]
MTIDYDVVIIGGSLAGRYAALAAIQLRATVALVEPEINYGFMPHQALGEIAKLAQHLGDKLNSGIHLLQANTAEKSEKLQLEGFPKEQTFQASPPQANTSPRYENTSSPTPHSLYFSCHRRYANDFAQYKLPTPHLPDSQISVAWPEAMLYVQGVVSNFEEQNSPAILAALGVDVIFGKGHFESSPQLAFAVNDNGQHQQQGNTRLLRGRSYLLASGSLSAVPEIDGLETTGYCTLANIWRSLNQEKPPKNWIIIGGVPQSIEVAQTLVRLGFNVTLIIKNRYLLPNIDPDVAILLQAQLEIDGVNILTETQVTQVKRIDNKKWIQAGDRALETDEILVATRQQPNLESFNLAEVGVKWHQHRLIVNNKLQTTNHRIYACGDVIGGYDFTNIANYEARIALQNALFFPRLQVNYQSIPWAVLSGAMLAQVGLTETQAKRRFHQDEILVLQQYYKTVAAAQLRDETTGTCKLIVLRNGKILGATVLGAEARELINLIALAISQNIKVKHLANLSPVYPSFSEILEQTAREWGKQRLNSNTALQDFLDGFFHFRRNCNK